MERCELSVNESLDSITSTTRSAHSVMSYFHNEWALVVRKPAGVQTSPLGWSGRQQAAGKPQQPCRVSNNYQDGDSSSSQVLIGQEIYKKHKHTMLEWEPRQQGHAADRRALTTGSHGNVSH